MAVLASKCHGEKLVEVVLISHSFESSRNARARLKNGLRAAIRLGNASPASTLANDDKSTL